MQTANKSIAGSLLAASMLTLAAPLPAQAAGTTTTTTTTTTTRPSFDTRTRELRIPCLDVRGIVVHGTPVEDAKYDVVMKQRGQSSNWEITFVNPGCAGTMPPADPAPAGS